MRDQGGYPGTMIDVAAIKARFDMLSPILDECGRRLFAATEARAAGQGGILAVHQATGIARSTIGRGLADCVVVTASLRGACDARGLGARRRPRRSPAC